MDVWLLANWIHVHLENQMVHITPSLIIIWSKNDEYDSRIIADFDYWECCTICDNIKEGLRRYDA